MDLENGSGLRGRRTRVRSKDLQGVVTGNGMGAVYCDTPARPHNVVDSKVFDGRGHADIILVIADFVYGVGNVGDAMAGAKDGIGGGLRSGWCWSWGCRWRSRRLVNRLGLWESDAAAGACGLFGNGESVIAEGEALCTRMVVHAMEGALKVIK